MSDTRRKNVDWIVGAGKVPLEAAQLAVLMDLRDELQTLNNLLGCPNFTQIPAILRDIRRHTAKKKKEKKK